jgi:hypothetical protein
MRAWEILEKRHDDEDSRYGKRMGMKDHISKLDKMVDEIYECGFEDGYSKAQEEMGSYGERSSYRRGGSR